MNALQVWKRLLWKESREGWLVVLIALLVPPVVFKTALALPQNDSLRSLLIAPGAIGLHLAVAFWGIGRGNSKRSGSEFSWTHLPTSPLIEWLASFVAPMVVIGLLGTWFGWIVSPSARDDYSSLMPIVCALDLATTFVICYLISLVVSNWAAIIFGVFRLFGGTLIAIDSLRPVVLPIELTAWFAARTVAGAVLGTLMYTVVLRKKSVTFRQGIALLSVLVVTFAPVMPNALKAGREAISLWHSPADTKPDMSNNLSYWQSSDRSVVIQTSKPYRPGYTHFSYKDYRKNKHEYRTIHADAHIIAGRDDEHIYLLRFAGKKPTAIIEWNARLNKMKPPIILPTLEIWNASVSPDGRYLALVGGSKLGRDYDLWLVDLMQRKSKVILPNMLMLSGDSAESSGGIAWHKDEIGVWGAGSGALLVNIHTLATRRITFDDKEAGKL